MTLPPPPPAPEPTTADFNKWADYWYYEIGVNVVPAVTKYKTGKEGYDYAIYHHKPVPEDVFAKWKSENAFADGMSIIISKVWRGPYKHPMKDTYLIFIDLDNQLAIDEFCTNKDGVKTPLQDVAEQFLIEQHKDNPHKCHVYFYSDVPFPKKSSDKNKPGIDETKIPMIEVKGRNGHGIAYCTPSVHKDGHRYEIIGTKEPTVILEKEAANEMIQRLDSICRKHGLQYLENVDSNGNTALVPISNLFQDDVVIYEGHNRHEALLRVMESLLKRNYGILSLDEIKELAYKWNQKHCQPPLDDREFQKQWKDATKFISRQIERQEEEEEKQQQQVQQQPEQSQERPPEELAREVSWDDISEILNTSIKKDKAAKLITFCGMLLAQTDEDQLNIGFQAESSAGKSYIPIEVSTYFPKEEIMLIASASPTAFYHDGGIWDAENKVIVKDLEHKNVILLDQAHFLLLEKLRPLLSKDRKELRFMITDKNQKHGLRTKNVIIRGYPSVFFCSTKADPDEQEKTRMLLLSPSVDQEKLRESLELATLRRSNQEEYNKQVLGDPKRNWLIERIRWLRQWGIRDVIVSDNGASVRDRFLKQHPKLQPRHQRDYPRIFSFIKAHAILNCFSREKIDNKRILATAEDINAGFELYQEIELSNELGVSPHVFNIFKEVIAPLLVERGCVEGVNGITREDIAKKYYAVRHKMLNPDILRKDILPQLEIVGLISQEPDPDKRSRIIVYPTVSTTYIISKMSVGDNGNSEQ